MPIIKKQIKKPLNDININIPIGNLSNKNGQHIGIQTYVNQQRENSLNEGEDYDVAKFNQDYSKYPDEELLLYLLFYNEEIINTWDGGFNIAGFTNEEILLKRNSFSNSFFIFDFYDTYDTFERTKLFSNYYTLLEQPPSNDGIDLKKIKQLQNILIPRHHLSNIGDDIYVNILFYNAKLGRVVSFFNGDNYDFYNEKFMITTDERLFFNVKLDKEEKKWWFVTATPKILHAYELITSPNYSEKVNNTNINTITQLPDYPGLKIFDYKTGNYIAE